MDQSGNITAADIVNWYSVHQLEKILLEFGEEVFAAKIARAIVERRKKAKFVDTLDLAKFVERLLPAYCAHRDSKFTHPATRTFQALRVAVNNELGELHQGLTKAFSRMATNGVLITVSFQALEDRLVKDFMRHVCTGIYTSIFICLYLAGWAIPCLPGHSSPQEDEISANRRCRTAKLRAIKKIQLNS
jgi:16S rRNA (cytosine1402-N4)-methyltransferase